MKVLISLLLIFSNGLVFAEAPSELVDVNKESKLSDYFAKMNKKVSSDSETTALEATEKTETGDKALAEEDILLTEAKSTSKKQASMSPVNKMMLAVFGLLIVAGFVLAGVQRMGKKQGHTEIAKNIKVLTQKSLGPKKSLTLVRVAGETILLGVTDQNINHIKTLSLMEDELPQYVEPKFSNQLRETIDRTKITDEKEEVDGFSVSRLDEVKNAVTERFSLS